MIGSHVLMGNSTMIRHVQHLVNKIADANASPVLIVGEPGTEKETLAKIIHNRICAAESPFIKVKCDKANEALLEIELFGSMQAAMSQMSAGAFINAKQGTVFLEEVGKLSLTMQIKILKAIKEKMISPSGADQQIPVQAHVILSSSENLEQKVKQSAFHEELYYALSRHYIYLPALRERREDIPVLAEYFIQRYSQRSGKKFSGVSYDVMHALLQSNWEYNLYELENLIERILVLKNGGVIEVADLPPKLRQFITDDINHFYEGAENTRKSAQVKKYDTQEDLFEKTSAVERKEPYSAISGRVNREKVDFQSAVNLQLSSHSVFNEMTHEIENFIKKEIDLGSGIDFYRVVEEFENKLISEALRRTNHNKNRASQLLSMNRTTLVEKLKKRSFHSSSKDRINKTKKNQAFTIFDELGSEKPPFQGADFIEIVEEETL